MPPARHLLSELETQATGAVVRSAAATDTSWSSSKTGSLAPESKAIGARTAPRGEGPLYRREARPRRVSPLTQETGEDEPLSSPFDKGIRPVRKRRCR